MERLRSQVEQATREADEVQREAEQRSQALEEQLARETESSRLRAEVEKFRALEELRGEHQRAMERERKVMDDWMQDVKERFRVEQQRFEERISALEATRLSTPAPRAPSASGSSTHAHRSTSRSDDLYPPSEFHELEVSELSDGSERESEVEDDGTGANNETNKETSRKALEHQDDPTQSDSDADGGSTEPPTLMQTMTKLLQAQTQAMAAQALATAVHHLPPLLLYTGEKEQAEDEGFDRWLERFEERSALAGWTAEQKLHQLKLLLDKTAREVFRSLPEDERSNYDKATQSLKKWFRTGDIEELRGLEFHHRTQGSETVEQLGIDLQRLGRKAFPSSKGKEFDRLLKGRFFQALHVKWQRKLGAPKPQETFRELYDRARTLEQHEKQYAASAASKSDAHRSSKKNEQTSQPPKDPATQRQDSGNESLPPTTSSNSQTERHRTHRKGRFRGGSRDNQPRRESRPPPEAPGRSDTSRTAVVGQVPKLDDFSDEQLKAVLAKRHVDREQQLLIEASTTSAVSAVEDTKGAVGPTLYLDILIEGVPVRAMFDTGAQSSIVSREVLHAIGRHLGRQGRPVPTLRKPCTTLFGKDGDKGPEIVVTAQFDATVEADGKTVCATLFVQPDSVQPCLLGTNIIPYLGVSITRANGEALATSPQSEPTVSRVCLVQATTIPSQKGRFIKCRVDSNPCQSKGQADGNTSEVKCCLFEPACDVIESHGLCSHESLITLNIDGMALIPVENYQGLPVKLKKGMQLGVVRSCDLPETVKVDTPEKNEHLDDSRCAAVKALSNTPERFQQLLQSLELPVDKLSPIELDKLKEVLTESTDIFALDDSELGCTNLVRHTIPTENHTPIKQRPYRTPVIYREKIEQMVSQMQAQGIVRPSRSPWASPIVLVPKKDGSLRFCVDFRKLNSITKKDVYQLPRVEDILDTLGEAKYFSSLDLASGYWQVELDEDACAKSAFTTHHGLFEFTRMPFGLCNAPATFQRAMQAVLSGLEWNSCFVYLDDILIASRTLEEHLQHMKEVFGRLRDAGLRLKPKKCLLLRDQVPYLGHVISAEGIRPDPAKTDKVKCFPVPHDVTTLRQFIGLASYYRRFVPGFAKVAAPLHALTKKDVSFNWTPQCDEAFSKLKNLLVTAPVLAYPHFGSDKEFILETDASGLGLGAVLSQRQEDGLIHPIAYASRSLNSHEQNDCISELETLGLVWAVRYFRPYLLGHHTIVYTDHSACLSLLNTPRPSGKLARWAMTVQEMDLTLKHRSGKQNANADALSRNPVTDEAKSVDSVNNCEELEYSNDNMCSVGVVQSVASPNKSSDPANVSGGSADTSADSSVDNDCPGEDAEVANDDSSVNSDCTSGDQDIKLKESLTEIRELQLKDPELAVYITYLEQKVLPENDSVAKRIVLESKRMELIDGVLHREDVADSSRWCVVVPCELRSNLLKEAHSCVFSGHFSERKVYDRLRRSYWWHGMRSDVRKFCRGCLNCATRKGPGRGIRPPLQPIPVKGPFHRVGVDILQLPLTSSGNKYLVVFLDYLTKWVEAYPVPDQRAETIARLLVENIVCRHGVPEELLSDRGANFLSDLILEICSLLGIKKVNTSGYHPQTDGLVEKFNSTITNMIAKSVDVGVEWDKQLPMLLFAYRSTIQESTRESPFFLVYGRDPRLPTTSTMELPRPEYTVDLDDYKSELVTCLVKAHEDAREQIKKAQVRQKKFYDMHAKEPAYKVGERVMVYMPTDVTGKERKLARPYHGPYRIVTLTPTNAEVKLVDSVDDPSIFVALDRLRHCYPEIPDTSWTGRRKTRKRKSKHAANNSTSRAPPEPRTTGPVTRAMTRRLQENN